MIDDPFCKQHSSEYNIFEGYNNLPFEEATYTLAGVGSKARTYNSGENGRIYILPLMESHREIVMAKAFSVENILTDKIERMLPACQ